MLRSTRLRQDASRLRTEGRDAPLRLRKTCINAGLGVSVLATSDIPINKDVARLRLNFHDRSERRNRSLKPSRAAAAFPQRDYVGRRTSEQSSLGMACAEPRACSYVHALLFNVDGPRCICNNAPARIQWEVLPTYRCGRIARKFTQFCKSSVLGTFRGR
jgi:hypothetical protein